MLCGYYECWGGVSLFSAQLSLPGSESGAADGAGPLLHSGSGDCDSEVPLSTTYHSGHSPGSRSEVVLSGNNPVIPLSPVTGDSFQDANEQNRTELIGI